MTDIHDVQFPLSLSFGASGGPERMTEIYTAASGFEHRNAPHSRARRRYDAGVGIKSLSDLHTLIAFFEARQGQLYGFLFRDPMDDRSCAAGAEISALDQPLGTGDGVSVQFSLIKVYQDSAGQAIRPISFPRPASLKVAVNGTEVSASWDSLTRKVTLPTPPPAGAAITAGFVFDVPVRFDTPALTLALQAFGAGQAAHIPLIEVKTYA